MRDEGPDEPDKETNDACNGDKDHPVPNKETDLLVVDNMKGKYCYVN